ncbi:hypothetical protein AOQ89_02455 [bacterium endosymbiont of Pedicinus badii]|nr:hypothetical protein AOQ89_02455 [bacterium endosymbiont of Pedicinus badii]
MDIGTNKPNKKILKKIPHHLINIINPTESFSVAKFCKEIYKKLPYFFKKKKIPILVGGSMFYFNRLLLGLSPNLPKSNEKIRNLLSKIDTNILYKVLKKIDFCTFSKIHRNDKKRIIRAIEVYLLSGRKISSFKKEKIKKISHSIMQFGIVPKKKYLYQAIETRFYKMIDMGLEREVINLIEKYKLNKSSNSMKIIGYRQMLSYISKKIRYEEMCKNTIFANKNLIKKQMTWLKKWKNVFWIKEKDTHLQFEIFMKIYKKLLFSK